MRRYLFAAIAAAIAALLTVLPASAANNVLTINSTGGPAVNDNDVLQASLKSGSGGAIFQKVGSSNKVTCTTSSFSATVKTGGNPPAPGTASESLTAHSFSSCTINVAGASISGVNVDNLPYNASVTSGGVVTISPGAAGAIQTTVKVVVFGVTNNCVYHVHDASGNLTGTAMNSDNSIGFATQRFDRVSGNTTVCFAQADFTATYAPVKDHTQGDAIVFLN